MRYEIRPAAFEDILSLRPTMPPAEALTFRLQVACSQAFALTTGQGRLIAAGGFWKGAGHRQAWMVWAEGAPARAMVEGVRAVIAAAGAGDPIFCAVDACEAKHIRFLELVGYRRGPEFDLAGLSSATEGLPSLPSRVIRMEWPS